jgi:UDP-N-acetylmuramoyl-tripeptide--D-alanyl-D-alanine ligase
MQKTLDILVIFLALGSIINSTLYYTYFWQLKEYRFDRMRDFLTTPSGRARVLNIFWWIRLLILMMLLISLLIPVNGEAGWTGLFTGSMAGQVFYYLTLALAVAELFNAGIRLLRRRLYRPDATAKAYLIVLLTIALTLAPAVFYLWWPALFQFFLPVLVFATLLTPLVNALLMAVFYPITLISKKIVLNRARKKISRMPGLKVIGITGSYGKSSTKEFLATILESRFRVLKTPGNTNTEIGVARIILKNLKPEHEVFIVEAGAYKIGEIKKICAMAVPRIGVITAVKDSHLALFGSLENIQKAKFEMIESLPAFGTAIFNADNEGSAELAKKAEGLNLGKIITYGQSSLSSLRATDITESLEGLRFRVEGVQFSAPLPGRHNVSNLLGAMAAGQELGLTLQEMVEQVKKVKLREHTLTVEKPHPNLVLLDDTYNANPDGVTAALNYLNLYQGWQKIIIFPGMLELGEKSAGEHQLIAAKISEVCDYAYFTSFDFREHLTEVLEKNKFKNYQFTVGTQDKLFHQLKERMIKNKTVILFISRGSEQVLKKLKNAF